MPGIIGKKIGMTSLFTPDGKNIPCTLIEAGPCVVTQVKTIETDGYNAVQLGYGEKKTKRTKPKDDEDDEDEEEEDDVSDDDDDDAAVPEEDDDDDEDANPKAKKPAGAEKDRKVKTTGKADPVPVVDDDDDDE